MQRLAPFPRVVRRLGALVMLVLMGCDPSPTDVREWTAQDHDQPAGAGSRQGPSGKRKSAGNDAIDLTELAWQKNCATCHGMRGAGDGPQGPMVKAPDLTRPDWQAKVTDAEMVATIKNGKNKMPKFDLPPAVLDGIVKRIRAAKGAGSAPPGD